jgi:putative ABC transport system permease protein
MSLPLTYGLRSIWRRRANAMATAFGIAMVVFVLAASLMLSAGIRATMLSAGNAGRAIVLDIDAYAEPYSKLPQSALALVAAAPGVRRGSDGRPLISGEAVVHIPFDKVGVKNEIYSVLIRGVSDDSFRIRPEVRIIDGRPPKIGTNEAIIGKAALNKYEGLSRDGGFELKKSVPFKIVGVFASGGSAYESEVWADLDALRASLGWQGSLSSVTTVLESDRAFRGFDLALTHDKRQGLKAEQESAYYRRLSRDLSSAMQGLGAMVAFICALGALLGAMITMYGSVAERSKEIGTLRALGFSGRDVLFTFMIESTCLAGIGGLIGSGLALLTSFLDFTTTNVSTDQAITFRFEPEPSLLLGALAGGILVGVCGGFFPALKAATVPPVQAIRAR